MSQNNNNSNSNSNSNSNNNNQTCISPLNQHQQGNVYSNIPNSTTYTYGSNSNSSNSSNSNSNNNNNGNNNKNHSPLTTATDGLTKMDIEEKWDNKTYEKDEREKSPVFHISTSNFNSFGNLKIPGSFSLFNKDDKQHQQQQQQQHLPTIPQEQTLKSEQQQQKSHHGSGGVSLLHAHSQYQPSNATKEQSVYEQPSFKEMEQKKIQQEQQHALQAKQQQLQQQQQQQQAQQSQQAQQQAQQSQQLSSKINTFFLPPPSNARERLKEFKQIRVIGTGTFGKVYLVQNTKDSCYYAMKCLSKAYVVQLKQVEHLNSEKSILSSIHHPFIVNLYQAFQDEKKLYLLFEYVAGGEVFTHLRKSMKFSNSTAKFYAAEIVLALEFLHKQNIVYRDLKPENLLIDNEGHIKITDFGFAKRVEDRTFTLCGTPEYLAPEIIQSRGHGKAVDWWALGILIFEMLAGYPPFYDDDTFAIYNKILAGRITFPLGFDVDAKDLIKRLLTADRTRRLGALKDGAQDVKNHRWFSDINWERLYQRKDPGPFIPNIQHEGDSSNFELYEEENMVDDPPSPNYIDPYANFFKDF